MKGSVSLAKKKVDAHMLNRIPMLAHYWRETDSGRLYRQAPTVLPTPIRTIVVEPDGARILRVGKNSAI